jgi:hypothetical protein
VSVLLGIGDGSFVAERRFGVGGQSFSVVVGDFDGDGVLDLAVANFGSSGLSVLLGVGDGSFGAEHRFGVGGATYSVASGDFNKDGKLDLAAVNYTFDVSAVSILLNDTP